MKMKNWTVTDVADRFEEAVYILRRLPRVRVQGYFNLWPEVLRTSAEQLQSDKKDFKLGPPAADAISRMEETILWMFLLDSEEERRLVWLRAARVPWKRICIRFGWGRTKAWHVWTVALLKIATQLNVKPRAQNVRT
jgi:hypothetical protein